MKHKYIAIVESTISHNKSVRENDCEWESKYRYQYILECNGLIVRNIFTEQEWVNSFEIYKKGGSQ